jgi:hypothetical protein
MPLFNMMKSEPITDAYVLCILSCITDLNAVAGLIEAELAIKGDALWTEVVYVELRTNPIVHRLLGCSAHTRTMPPQYTIFEALRIGAILWIVCIKRRCGSFLGSPTDYISTIFDLLSVQYVKRDTPNAPDCLAIRSWLLIICGISACDPVQRQSCINFIASEMRKLRWDWAQLMTSAHEMPWIIEFDAPCARLKEQIQLGCNV